MELQLQAFLEYLQREYNYSNNTTAAYKNDLNQFVKFVKTNYASISKWSDVNPSIVEAYVDLMKENVERPDALVDINHLELKQIKPYLFHTELQPL